MPGKNAIVPIGTQQHQNSRSRSQRRDRTQVLLTSTPGRCGKTRLTTSTSRSTKCLRWEAKTQNSWPHCHIAQVRHNFIATWEDPDAGHPTSWTWSWFAFKSLPLVEYYEKLNVKYWEKSDQIHPENKKPEIKHCKLWRCPQITNPNACLTESKYSPRISSCKFEARVLYALKHLRNQGTYLQKVNAFPVFFI